MVMPNYGSLPRKHSVYTQDRPHNNSGCGPGSLAKTDSPGAADCGKSNRWQVETVFVDENVQRNDARGQQDNDRPYAPEQNIRPLTKVRPHTDEDGKDQSYGQNHIILVGGSQNP